MIPKKLYRGELISKTCEVLLTDVLTLYESLIDARLTIADIELVRSRITSGVDPGVGNHQTIFDAPGWKSFRKLTIIAGNAYYIILYSNNN